MQLKKYNVFVMAATAVFSLTACGGDSDNSASVSPKQEVVSSIYNLGDCTEDIDGDTVFVKDKKTDYICLGGEWVSAEDKEIKSSCSKEDSKDSSSSTDGKSNYKDARSSSNDKSTSSSSSLTESAASSSSSLAETDSSSSSSEDKKDSLEKEQPDTVAIKDITISGITQKGPFVKGSLVTAYELDGSKSLLQTGRSFSGSITQDDGRFNLSNVTLKSSYVRLSANGYYRNEVTGKNSAAPITLNAITDLSSRNTVNVNLLTHLELGRVSRLMEEGDGTIKMKTAKKQAEKEIFEAFHFDVSDFDYSEDLDAFGKTDADAALLAVSILLQGDRNESELTELLAELSEDLSDGKWDDSVKKAEIADWAFVKEYENKLAGYHNNVMSWRLSSDVPNFEKHMQNFWLTEKMGSCTTENDGSVVNIPTKSGVTTGKKICSQGKWVCGIQGEEFVDNRDGNRYRTVKIGNQIWMAENLNYKVDSSFCYNNQDSNCTKYGRLYTWSAAVGMPESECGLEHKCSLPSENVQGVCPQGWHLPSTTELEALLGVSRKNLESASDWHTCKVDEKGNLINGDGNLNSTDECGFSALPARTRDNGSSNFDHTAFWSSSEKGLLYASSLEVNCGSGIVNERQLKNVAYSIRCIQD